MIPRNTRWLGFSQKSSRPFAKTTRMSSGLMLRSFRGAIPESMAGLEITPLSTFPYLFAMGCRPDYGSDRLDGETLDSPADTPSFRLQTRCYTRERPLSPRIPKLRLTQSRGPRVLAIGILWPPERAMVEATRELAGQK